MQAGFSAKDLALALPDKDVGDSLSLRYIQDGNNEAGEATDFKPNIDPKKKVIIYRAGKRPDWEDEEEEETWVQKLNKPEARQSFDDASAVKDSRLERLKNRDTGRAVQEAAIIDEGDDSDEERERAKRRARAKARRAERGSDDEDAQPEYAEGDIIPGDMIPEPEEEEEDDDVIASRRQAIRDKLRKRQEQEEMAVEEEEGEEKKEEEDSDEWETDTDEEDEEAQARPLFRPMFVNKQERDTIAEKEKKEAEAAEAEERRLLELESRKIETRQVNYIPGLTLVWFMCLRLSDGRRRDPQR